MNQSGIKPTVHQVLIKDDRTDDRIGSIIIPVAAKDESKFAAQKGVLVDVSPLAFNFDNMWNGAEPKVGDRVFYNKYSGQILKGKDGEEYRLCEDKSICAVIEEGVQ